MTEIKEERTKDKRNIDIQKIQTTLSISYVLAVGIGMLFYYQKYSEFGINIFEYADVFDFLIAPFADFKIGLFTVFSLTIPYGFYKVDRFLERKYPKIYSIQSLGLDRKSWYSSFRYILFSMLFIAYLYVSADVYGESSKKQIVRKSSIEIQFSDHEIKKGKMIGKTTDVIFLLNGKRVSAIPISSLVKEVEIR